MKIESIIQRKGGTQVNLGGKAYDFQPDKQGRHVCEVTNEDHIGRLLAITEGYRIAKGSLQSVDAKPENDPNIEAGNTLTPSDDGQEQTEGEAEESADEAEEAEEAEAEAGEPEADETEDEGNAEEEAAAPEQLDREALAVKYQESTGSRPHGKWTAERIAQELAELDDQEESDEGQE